ncbi:MAG: MarR family transcriptional regulator [Waterburya sp.]
MPQTKIQGKFYPLKSEEWLDSINKLTHSELKILYYVRSLDPYNNGINLTPAQIARDLSTKKNKMHRSTVGRALKSLDRKGFINMELLQVRVKVNAKGFLAEPELEKDKNNVVATQQCCDHATQVVATQHRVQPHNIECAHTTQSAPTQQPKAEIQSEQELENPKTLKTYTDFKKTLSEDERENFFNFVEEKTNNLEKEIIDLEAWLASKTAAKQNRWEIYYKKFQEEKIKEKSRNNKQHTSSDYISPEKFEAIAKFNNRHKEREQELQQIKEQEQLKNAENNLNNQKNE